MSLRLRIYALLKRLIPVELERRLGSSNLIVSIRDALFRPGGSPKIVTVRSAILGFVFSAPIQVAYKASTRGIESTLSRLIANYISPGMTCIDIGASYGFITLVMASRVGAEGQVYSFEPNELAFDILASNIADNNFNGTVTINWCAIGSSNQDSFPMVIRYGTSHHPSENEMADGTAPVRTLDSLADEIGIGKVDLMKIDVDGIEYDVILGSGKLIKQHMPVLIVELNREVANIVKFLTDLGYQLMSMRGEPIAEPTSGMNLVACTREQAVQLWGSNASPNSIN